MDRRKFVGELLSFFELREVRLLSWGFYEPSFDAAAVEEALNREGPADLAAAWAEQRASGSQMAELLEQMRYQGLLHGLETLGRYRTRFAETTRLLARLRQLFRPEDWTTGPALVSDIKLHLAPRRYPRWDQQASACWQDLVAHCRCPDVQEAVFGALAAGRDGASVRFAGFQRRAFARILERYGAPGLTGSVVSAGTGSGKTKAFYVPAFLGVAADLTVSQAPYTKVIAIYPRNVLLSDQLREALSEAAKVRAVLARRGLRPITFGALLGDTPWDNYFERAADGRFRVQTLPWGASWRRVRDGFVVPFVKSPVEPERELVWRDADRERHSSALCRVGSATPDVPDGTLLITRNQIQRTPPDVLFVSLEMLNRELGNPTWGPAFGIGKPDDRRPRLLLLDEVHSYDGLQGAQAAWVLRRWIHWSRSRSLHVVGLSATLREAPRHLGLVTSTNLADIHEFSPAPEELELEGMEYNVAIKGDPSSGASLLATSIQTAMLLGRVQTPRHRSRPASPDLIDGSTFYARKIFGFSDNLDTLNRWMADMSDAERQRLAGLRLPPEKRRTPPPPPPPDVARRMRREGQVWDLSDRLDYDLRQPLEVTRCSSQDPGVSASSDIIVATSSLEVGYDDPDVAATLHHKAPRSMSSFIQRKGRAGRRRGTRPWTAVVLSDYGTDRWAFDHAERLFQPDIDSIFVPMSNPYILRVQATSFLIDWLGRRIGAGSPYGYLAEPKPEYREAQKQAIEILEDFLQQGPEWRRFRADLARAFRFPQSRGEVPMSEAALDAILWEPPRPVLACAVPTLLRKLQAQWAVANDPGRREDEGAKRPLPEYIPPATFADLDIAETRLVFRVQGITKADEHLGVSQALAETCPGNVSKRYATTQRERGYWLAGSTRLLDGVYELPIHDLYGECVLLGTADAREVYQPGTTTVEAQPPGVLETSKATWDWRSRIEAVGTGQVLPVLTGGPWALPVEECRAFLHRDRAYVDVLRFADSCSYEIRRRRSEPLVGRLRLRAAAADGAAIPQAVGFRQRVDGLLVRLRPKHLAQAPDLDAETLARFRPAFFRDEVAARLAGRVNVFLADWLAQTALAMLAGAAVVQRLSLEAAQGRLRGNRVEAARAVLERIFQRRDVENGDDEAEEARLVTRVLDLWGDPSIVEVVEDAEQYLWSAPPAGFDEWLRRRHAATLAQALRAAVLTGLPEVSEDDLNVDVVWTPEGRVHLYLTELGPGGLGQIELIARRLRNDPGSFHDALRHAIEFCPRHQTARTLRQTIEQVTLAQSPLRSAFETVRSAHSHQELERARDMLTAALADSGLPRTRGAVVSIMMRLLRPGSSPRTDQAIRRLDRGWHRMSARLGVAIDPRVLAYLCVRVEPVFRRLDTLFREIGDGQALAPAQIFALVQQMLIVGCEDSCRECLDNPNRYNDFGRPSRALSGRWIGVKVPEVRVEVGTPDWVATIRATLVASRRVRVVAAPDALRHVAPAIQELLTAELEAGHLLLPVSVTGVDRDPTGWRITLQLGEGDHG